MEAWLVLTTLPDDASARELAGRLVDLRVAACVSIQAPCVSIYRWQGQTEQANEVTLLIKTTASAYPRLEAIVREHHPYDVPELIAVPIVAGLPAYLGWLTDAARIEESC